MQDERNRLSRRDLLRRGAAVGATGLVVGMAGCQRIKGMLGLGRGKVAKMPEGADATVFVDVAAAKDDDGVEALADAYLDRRSRSDYYDGPTDYEDALELFEEETDLDPSKARWAQSFSSYSEFGVYGDYFGTVFKGTWDEDDVVDAFEEEYDTGYDEDDHEGKTLYEPEDDFYVPYLGVPSNNVYVSGPPEAVEDVIDRFTGSGDRMDEELRKGFNQTRNAPVRFSGAMPEWITGEVTDEGRTIDLDELDAVDYVAGSIYRNGDERAIETTMKADDADDAEAIKDVLEGAFAIVEEDENTDEFVRTFLDEAEVAQNGKKVVITYEASVDDLENLIEDSMGG